MTARQLASVHRLALQILLAHAAKQSEKQK
jgi:hypothetical protein